MFNLKDFGGELRFGNVTPFQICFSLLSFPTLLKNMFYNYLIFNIVALSLRIFKKHFVSHRETLVPSDETLVSSHGTKTTAETKVSAVETKHCGKDVQR